MDARTCASIFGDCRISRIFAMFQGGLSPGMSPGMSKSVLPLALISTLLIAAIGYLLLALQRERGRAEEQVRETAALRAELSHVIEIRERLDNEVHELRAASAKASRDGAPAAQPSSLSAAVPERGPGVGGPVPPASWKPPELSTEQRQAMTRRRYGTVFRELGFSEEQIEALLPVLVAQDKLTTALRPAADRATSPSNPDATRDRAEIAAIVGSEKAAQFETARKTLPARSQLSFVRMQLDEAGSPISEDQRQKLLAVMSRHEQPAVPTPVPGEPPEQTADRFRTWQAERDRQFREDSESILTPQQKKRLDEMQSLQSAMRIQMRVANEASGAAGSPPH
jgi:hypothetical protein